MFIVRVRCIDGKSYEFTVNRELDKTAVHGIEDALILRCNLGDEEYGDLFVLTISENTVTVSEVEEQDFEFVKEHFNEEMVINHIDPQPGGMWVM